MGSLLKLIMGLAVAAVLLPVSTIIFIYHFITGLLKEVYNFFIDRVAYVTVLIYEFLWSERK